MCLEDRPVLRWPCSIHDQSYMQVIGTFSETSIHVIIYIYNICNVMTTYMYYYFVYHFMYLTLDYNNVIVIIVVVCNSYYIGSGAI